MVKKIIRGRAFAQKKRLDDDHEQAVIIGVWQSLAKYTPEKGRLYSFITKSAQNHIRWYELDKIKKDQRRVRYGVEFTELTGQEVDTSAEGI